jgi:hypothetical protein
MLLAFWSAVYVPYTVSFKPWWGQSIALLVTSTCIDLVFIIDLILNFYTTYINALGEEIMDHRMIVRNYLKG